ncbi:uncharacterized protein Bfra_007548 [Botrytis fragariae]|uniref:Uncharacterized protein n=1 Tax=Botrytis fragariae TaxID=1964551 RepID=A0A8H6EDX7_9HELO|nr:uncharacterized protein Bfra_007548 [Botrytis fragariae]KAF5868350.1 hypothetical protein Bfra_007548 [Botrytis fragariae]
MCFSYSTSAIAILCVLHLSFASVIDRLETSSRTNERMLLLSRGNSRFNTDVKNSEFCLNSAKKPSACMVAYGITNAGKKDNTPIEVGTFAFPCDGDALLEKFNHEKSTQYYGLNQAFEFITFIGNTKPGYNNIKLSIDKYGDLKGRVHAPVISIEGHQLPVTNTTIVAKDWADASNRLIWVASYPCKN